LHSPVGFSLGVAAVFSRLLFVAALGLLVSGYIAAPNTLSPEQVSSFRLQAVDVTVVPNARISWWGRERELAGSGDGASEAQTRQVIAAKMRDSMMREVGSHLVGARPVRISVRIHEFTVTPGAVRILLGGNHSIKADIDVVDGKTGAPLLAIPAYEALVQGGNGPIGVALDNLLLDEPADRIIRHYVLQYRNWLLRK
jgi:hypothetical protein